MDQRACPERAGPFFGLGGGGGLSKVVAPVGFPGESGQAGTACPLSPVLRQTSLSQNSYGRKGALVLPWAGPKAAS